jgi:hypothetical protein
MSFLDDLENNKNKHQIEKPEKSSRDLFESCFKYFRHFCTILKSNEQTYDSNFDFTFLNIRRSCKLVGPFELNRIAIQNHLKLEFKMITQLNEPIKIQRKDERSAIYLQSKLIKDGLQSLIKKDADDNIFVIIKEQIHSKFYLTLENENNFFIKYININTSTNRKLKLPVEKINQEMMDILAQYILGKKPDLYTETISEEEKQKIREKIEENKKKTAELDAQRHAEILEQNRLDELAKANTFKEKTKRYITKQSKTLGANLLKRIKDLKKKDDTIG